MAVVVAGTAVMVVDNGDEAPAVIAGPGTTEPTDGSTAFDDAVNGFTIDVPADWVRAKEPLVTNLGNQERLWEIFAAGTGPLVPNAYGDCAVLPVKALENVGLTGALVWILEPRDERRFGARPTSFRDVNPRDLAEDEACFNNGLPPVQSWFTAFTENERSFYMFVAIGEDAPSSIVDAAWGAADSFRPGVTPTSP